MAIHQHRAFEASIAAGIAIIARGMAIVPVLGEQLVRHTRAPRLKDGA